MKEMGFISRRADPEVFDRVVQYFHDKLRGQMSVEGFSLKDLSFEADKSLGSLLDLRELNVSLADLRDAFHIPKEWILLERTLLLLLGVCTTLDPEMNPTDVIEPYLERFLLGEKKQWSEVVVDASREMALAALSLPGELQRFMDRALRGDLELRVAQPRRQRAPALLRRAAAPLGAADRRRGGAGDGLVDGRGHGRRRLGGRHRVRGCSRSCSCSSWFAGRPRRERRATLTRGRSPEYLQARPPHAPHPASTSLRSPCSSPPVLAVAAPSRRDLIRRRQDPSAPWSSTPSYLLVGAGMLAAVQDRSVVPEPGRFAQPWTPVPIYAYGVMLGTSLVVGWFIAMRLAKHDGIDQQDAGNIYMWSAIWSIIGSRLLCVLTTPEFDSLTQRPDGQPGRPGRLRRDDRRVPGQRYCCRKRRIPLLQWADVAAPSVVLGTGDHPRRLFAVRLRLRRAPTCPGRSGSPGRTTLAPHGSPAWHHHVHDFGLAARRALVVPGAPDADLRIAGRAVRCSRC